MSYKSNMFHFQSPTKKNGSRRITKGMMGTTQAHLLPAKSYLLENFKTKLF